MISSSNQSITFHLNIKNFKFWFHESMKNFCIGAEIFRQKHFYNRKRNSFMVKFIRIIPIIFFLEVFDKYYIYIYLLIKIFKINLIYI